VLVNCPECDEEVSDQAAACPYCGYPIRPQPPVVVEQPVRRPGFEWKSRLRVGRWPLVHVAFGWNQETGRLHVARGVIAIGQFAVGAPVAVAQFALGILFGLGQFATGLVAVGQVAFGHYVRAMAGYGRHVWSASIQDAEAVRFFRNLVDQVHRLLGR